MGRFDEMYRGSLDDVEEFWPEAAAAIAWVEPWERVLDSSRPPFYRWFAGGRLNSCHNALDRRVDGVAPTNCAHRGDPFGGLRRLCRQRACQPHRGCQAEGRGVGLVRDRAWT